MNIVQSLCLPVLLSLCTVVLLPSPLLRSQPAWQEFGELGLPRGYHDALYIGDGKVLVIGGLDYNQVPATATPSCEIINVRSGSVEPAGRMNNAHAEAVSLLTRDSNVVVVSGLAAAFEYGELTGSVEMYNRTSGQWTTLGSLNVARRQHVAAFINDREILVVGGRHKDHSTMARAEIFNISTGTSRFVASFPFPINNASMEVGSDGNIIVFAGREGGTNSMRQDVVYRYDVAADRWVQSGKLAKPLQGTCALKLRDGRILISGGVYTESPIQFTDLVQIENKGVWSTIGSMQTEREWGSAEEWDNGIALTGGGYDNDLAVLSSCDFVDVDKNVVFPGPTLIHPRAFQTFVTVPTCKGSDGALRGVVMLAIGGRASVTKDSGLTSIEILERRCVPEIGINAGRDTAICSGVSVMLGGTPTATGGDGSLQYRWQPSEGLTCNDCPNPVASPKRTTIYILTVQDGVGNQAFDTVIVTVGAHSVRCYIPTNIRVFPGDTVVAPLMLEPGGGQWLLEDLVVELRYQSEILELYDLLREGTLSEGATLSIEERSRGFIRFRLTGLTPGKINTLVNLQFLTWVGDRLSSQLLLSVRNDTAACSVYNADPGLITLDSICGLKFRLIELSNIGKNGVVCIPNPVQDLARIRCSIALDAYVELEVFDEEGRSVAQPVSEHLRSGHYDVNWNVADVPPGIYYARLSVGSWTDVARVVVMK